MLMHFSELALSETCMATVASWSYLMLTISFMARQVADGDSFCTMKFIGESDPHESFMPCHTLNESALLNATGSTHTL